MKLTEITYSKGQTIQLRQFEPVNIHISAKAEIGDEDPHEAYLNLQEIVDREVEIKIVQLDEKNSGKIARAGAKAVLEKQQKKEDRENQRIAEELDNTPSPK